MEDNCSRKEIIEIQSRAFRMFEEGRLPVDLVKEGVCTGEEASALFREYADVIEDGLTNIRQDQLIEELATQIGLLGSRLARIELQLINAFLLPRRFKCASCGQKGSYGVGIVCEKCGEVNAYSERNPDELLPNSANLEAYRPWDDGGE